MVSVVSLMCGGRFFLLEEITVLLITKQCEWSKNIFFVVNPNKSIGLNYIYFEIYIFINVLLF